MTNPYEPDEYGEPHAPVEKWDLVPHVQGQEYRPVIPLPPPYASFRIPDEIAETGQFVPALADLFASPEEFARTNGRLAGPLHSHYIHMKAEAAADFDLPVLAVESFLTAHDLGVYPPVEVLDWLATSLRVFYAQQGVDERDKPLNLGMMLGLTPGRGEQPPFQTLAQMRRNEKLFKNMACLKVWLAIESLDAAILVSNKLEATPGWNDSKFEVKELQPEKLLQMYSKGVRAYYQDWARRMPKLPASSDATARAWVESFPLHSVSKDALDKIKNYLK